MRSRLHLAQLIAVANIDRSNPVSLQEVFDTQATLLPGMPRLEASAEQIAALLARARAKRFWEPRLIPKVSDRWRVSVET